MKIPKNQIEAQRSGFDLERRSKEAVRGMAESCSERSGLCSDETGP